MLGSVWVSDCDVTVLRTEAIQVFPAPEVPKLYLGILVPVLTD